MLLIFSYWSLFLATILPASLTFAGQLAVHDETFQPDFVLRITEEEVPFACEGTRRSVLVNGTSPGPELRLKPNSTTWVRVYNDMDHLNTTIHWHGLAQRVAPFSDGSPLATQWPIPPRHFFDYQLFVDLDSAGTYFFHSHVGMQAITAAGALIIEDHADPPYAYDEERTILFSDFFNRTDEDIESGLKGVPFKWSGETNAVLLNGKGVSKLRQGAVRPEEISEECGLPVIDVEPNKTYRFRFIGGTSLSHVLVGFEDHSNLTIINVEGHYTQPYQVEHMQLGSGNRFDILFKTKTLEELAGRNSYIIQFETRERPETYVGFGVLRYDQSIPPPTNWVSKVLTLPNETYDWAEYSLTALDPSLVPFPQASEVSRRIILNTTQMYDISQHMVWTFNGLPWDESSYVDPLLINIYLHGQAAMPSLSAAITDRHDNATYPQGYDPNVKAFPVRNGEVIEVIFQNTGSLVNYGGSIDAHPFHGHGKAFFDIGSGNGTYDLAANERKIKERGWTPVPRDTTMLYRYGEKTVAGAPAGWRAWRIRMDYSGVWMVHCHTLQHMMMGMQMVWTVGDAQDIIKIPIELAKGYLDYGGSSYGNETYNPTVWEGVKETD